CRTEWDEVRCWYQADVGQIVNVSCSDVSQLFANKGYIFRNCTKDGWTELYPTYEEACEFAEESETGSETTYFSTISQVYTAGYATSLISLISAIFVFAVFRKFHCTRNYIHINLFSSFILRASAVFIKDGVLFADENLDHCFMSTGMYLQTLLALTFVSHNKYFWWYTLIGWGSCWDDTDKLKSPCVGGHDTGHFMRLAKSTLFLIPLFGMHYMVFAFLPENTGEEARIFIELGLGSFQGFVVALLYCFLNGEVQGELKKRLWKWQTQGYLSYSRRRRTLFTESSTVTQISVLEKSSPKELPCISDTHTHTHRHTLTHSSVSICDDTHNSIELSLERALF
ncbi:unnamed protein product, partial [Coregonus sp. 'balchen']